MKNDPVKALWEGPASHAMTILCLDIGMADHENLEIHDTQRPSPQDDSHFVTWGLHAVQEM